MSTSNSYQLTKYSVGTTRELFSLSWPLMLSFCSSSLMLFADRLYLAHHSLAAMNAMAVAANFCYLVLVFPFAICEITEVFVGRFHGAGRHQDVGTPTWQIIWLSIASWPLFLLVSWLLSFMLFAPTSLESDYITTFLAFGPLVLVSLALTGFFVGIGNTRIITYATLSANLVNLILAPLFIFGTSWSPAFGTQGAALATGLAQGFQALILFLCFINKRMRSQFSTCNLSINVSLTKEMMRIGLPAGTSRSLEVLAHCTFFYIMTFGGPLELTIATIVQSFFLLIVFCNDAMSKGVTAIISNLVGAKVFHLIPNVLKAGYLLQLILFCIAASCCLFGAENLYSIVLQGEEKLLLADVAFATTLKICLFLMCLFFLFDGFWWIVIGHLTAIGDTQFMLIANTLGQWLIYILPTYLLVTQAGGGAICGWSMITLNAIVLFGIFWWRSQTHLAKAYT